MKYLRILRLVLILLIFFYVLERINVITISFLDDVMHYVFNVIILLLSFLVFVPILSAIKLKRYKPEYAEEIQSILKELDPNSYIEIKITKHFLPNNAAVFYQGNRPVMIFGEKLVNKFNKEQLKFIIAHEISHIKNNDVEKNVISFITVIAIIPVILVLLAPLIISSFSLILGISIAIVIFLSGFVLHFYFSQKRELAADRFALSYVDKKVALGVLHELKKMDSLPEKSFSLFATHPSVKKRVKSILTYE